MGVGLRLLGRGGVAFLEKAAEEAGPYSQPHCGGEGASDEWVLAVGLVEYCYS